jgi:glycosyltransferase involved in cell wall biosynthesis
MNSNIPKHVLLYDPLAAEGHRIEYVRWITRALVENYGVQHVTLATAEEMAQNVNLKTLCGEFGSRFTIHASSDISRLLQSFYGPKRSLFNRVEIQFRHIFIVRTLINNLIDFNESGFVLFPCLDYCTRPLGVMREPFGDTPWGGIIHNVHFHMPAIGMEIDNKWYFKIERFLFSRMLGSRSLVRVFCVDPYFKSYINISAGRLAGKVSFLPHPIDVFGSESRLSARRALGIASDQLAVLVYGSLSRRKGIDALVNALVHEKALENVLLILAGHHERAVLDFMQDEGVQKLRSDDRLISMNRYFNDNDQRNVFKAADIVWLGYRGHSGPSGVLILAGGTGLPILATREGVIGRQTLEHELGEVVDVDDEHAVASALVRLTTDKHLRERYGANGKSAFSAHTLDNFYRTSGEGIIGASFD